MDMENEESEEESEEEESEDQESEAEESDGEESEDDGMSRVSIRSREGFHMEQVTAPLPLTRYKMLTYPARLWIRIYDTIQFLCLVDIAHLTRRSYKHLNRGYLCWNSTEISPKALESTQQSGDQTGIQPRRKLLLVFAKNHILFRFQIIFGDLVRSDGHGRAIRWT